MSNDVLDNIHTIIETNPYSKNYTEMKNGSVVFVFGNNMRPIACDIDFLYAETTQYPIYSVNQAEIGLASNSLFPNYDKRIDIETGKYIDPKNRSVIKYKFFDVIKCLIFKYGLKKEYYKNKYGKWIDITAIKPYFTLINPVMNPFGQLFSGTLNNNIKELSIYKQLCDTEYFEFKTDYNNIRTICEVKNLNDIPEIDYYVKEPNNVVYDSDGNSTVTYNNSGIMNHVGRGDGSYITESCEHISFALLEDDNVDIEHAFKSDSVRFSYALYDSNREFTASGDYDRNNHHEFNDLILTFVNADGVTPYTKLDNLLISLNGLIVDYASGPNPNQLVLKDVVKFAAYQNKGLKSGVKISDYTTIDESDLTGEKICNIDIPYDKLGINYKFDIQIHKWKNVTITHAISPNSIGKLLKYKETEPSKSYLLPTTLKFGVTASKENCILLCGNTIVDKDSWDVTSTGNVYLNSVSSEFDILYAEMYDTMRTYLKSIIDHNISDAPNLQDIINNIDNMTIEKLEEAYSQYLDELNEWNAATGGDNFHNTKSVFDIVVNQFSSRKYSLIVFGTEDNLNFEVHVIENKNDIKLNKPLRNHFRITDWNVDDIIVMNGMIHRFENKYDSVFTSPLTWYRMDNNGIYDDVNAYKLDVIKHYEEHDRFRKLTYGEMISGPKSTETYYRRVTQNTYGTITVTDDFEHTMSLIPDSVISEGVDPNETYFVKEGSEYKKVPILLLINNGFDINKKYYKKVFTREYYIKR